MRSACRDACEHCERIPLFPLFVVFFFISYRKRTGVEIPDWDRITKQTIAPICPHERPSAAHLRPNSALRTLCSPPKCGGGRGRKKRLSLSISKWVYGTVESIERQRASDETARALAFELSTNQTGGDAVAVAAVARSGKNSTNNGKWRKHCFRTAPAYLRPSQITTHTRQTHNLSYPFTLLTSDLSDLFLPFPLLSPHTRPIRDPSATSDLPIQPTTMRCCRNVTRNR